MRSSLTEIPPFSGLEQRGTLALLLYQETVRLQSAHLLAEHREAIELVMQMIHDALEKQVG